jgi:hypothetical protein
LSSCDRKNTIRPLEVPDTAPLFPALHAELVRFLRALSPADWERATVAGAWRVRDVAMHLLDGDLRTLAAHRDGHFLAPKAPVESYSDVLSLIQELNAGGVAFGRRLSPNLVTDLLEVTGRWVSDFVAALDPDGAALFPVAWAGEDISDNRMDTAREYTERWHHQMQMRTALDDEADDVRAAQVLLSPRFVMPLLDTSVRVLPHAYRAVRAPEGTAIVVALSDGPWVRTLRREGDGWLLFEGESEGAAARASSSVGTLWRHFFNALQPEEARRVFQVEGTAALLDAFWSARSVMV